MFEVAGDATLVRNLEGEAARPAPGLDTKRRLVVRVVAIPHWQDGIKRGSDRRSSHTRGVILHEHGICDWLLAAMLRNGNTVVTEVEGDIEDGERGQIG